ncbi:MAG TPA: dihydrolipoyllysine-residue acetyltransferase [Anaeromyxobacter sp.]|nr:dihydrolipoyllysine-residue acetyltransferase [Anaeromyxobacter sp.]
MSALEVKVPPIGDFKDVPVIEVLVKPGETVAQGDGLVTLESEKATLDVPAPSAGTVKELRVAVGDRVSEGSVVLLLETAGAAPARGRGDGRDSRAAPAIPAATATPTATAPPTPTAPPPSPPAPAGGEGRGEGGAVRPHAPGAAVHASPSIRRIARELGLDLHRVEGTGPNGRIRREDVQAFVKRALAAPAGAAAGGPVAGLPPWPKVDFAKYGPVETRPLSRIQRISGPALARNWVSVPHVTQFDEADITDLDAFRRALSEEVARDGVKVTLLAFVVKACVAALKRFPEVNASLEGDHLVVKRYWHVGFAADTPGGLVVPVLRNADQKGVLEIARELAALAAKAREGKLAPEDLAGGTFSISSLGGIGGTAFTPIVNAPEVAILGVSRATIRPVWDGKAFQPRLMLPLSFSYDHRVVDGALAARFTAFVAQVLGDMRRATL